MRILVVEDEVKAADYLRKGLIRWFGSGDCTLDHAIASGTGECQQCGTAQLFSFGVSKYTA